MELVASNQETTPKHRVIRNLKDCHGKWVSIFTATNGLDLSEGIDALQANMHDGLVERQDVPVNFNGQVQVLVYYRYRSELSLIRRYENSGLRSV